MKEYRHLTDQQIDALKRNDCWAQDWNEIQVTDDFDTKRFIDQTIKSIGNLALLFQPENVKPAAGALAVIVTDAPAG